VSRCRPPYPCRRFLVGPFVSAFIRSRSGNVTSLVSVKLPGFARQISDWLAQVTTGAAQQEHRRGSPGKQKCPDRMRAFDPQRSTVPCRLGANQRLTGKAEQTQQARTNNQRDIGVFLKLYWQERTDW
jgi:hypothetical protein